MLETLALEFGQVAGELKDVLLTIWATFGNEFEGIAFEYGHSVDGLKYGLIASLAIFGTFAFSDMCDDLKSDRHQRILIAGYLITGAIIIGLISPDLAELANLYLR